MSAKTKSVRLITGVGARSLVLSEQINGRGIHERKIWSPEDQYKGKYSAIISDVESSILLLSRIIILGVVLRELSFRDLTVVHDEILNQYRTP